MLVGVCPICKLGVATFESAKIVKRGKRTIVYHSSCYEEKKKVIKKR